jgi:hypothetical protein
MFGFGGRNQPRRDDRRQTSILDQSKIIDNILAQIGLNVDEVRMDTNEGYGWSFRRGSAVIDIYLSEQNKVGYLQVLSPIVHMPSTNLLPLYRRLLELNLQLTSAALGIYQDVIYVFYERPLMSLDADETNDIIEKVATYADELDDQIVSEFGGRLYRQV